MICLFLFPPAKELNVMNIVNILHDAIFADGDWEQLGQQLIDHASLATIRANRHGDSSLCMIDTIAQWLRTDAAKSWEKLAKAVAKVGRHCSAKGRDSPHRYVLSDECFCEVQFPKEKSFYVLNCSCRNNSESTRRDFFSTTIDF